MSRTDLLEIQDKIESRSALSISEKVRTWLNEIFRYALAKGLIKINPAANLDMAALQYRRNNHYPYLDIKDIPELMAKIPTYRGTRQTILGLKLLLLTGIRTSEMRFAEISQYKLTPGEEILRIPAKDVQQFQKVINQSDNRVPDYIVPLSRQAVEIVNELLSYAMPGQKYLFVHRTRSQTDTISENTLNKALRILGFKNRLCPHGMRATISTALNEERYESDFIEVQLSHKGSNTK